LIINKYIFLLFNIELLNCLTTTASEKEKKKEKRKNKTVWSNNLN